MLKFYKTLLLNLLFITSCSIVSFEELKIESNLKKNSIYLNEESFEIIFSIPVKESSLTEIISVYENSNSIKYNLIYEDTKIKITPFTNWKKGSYYSIKLNGNLLTSDNRIYEVSKTYNFFYKTDSTPFLLTNFITPNKTDKSLYLEFNKPINILQFEENFSITPFIRIKKEYSNDNKTVKILPEDNWTANTLYKFDVKKFLSEDNYELFTTYTQEFIPNLDIKILELKSIQGAEITDINTYDYKIIENSFLQETNVLKNIKINNALAFDFNKDVSIESFKTNFSISPKTNGNFYKDNFRIIFIPDENFNIQEKYTIKIDENIKDTNGIKLQKSIEFNFTPENNFLKIEKININGLTNLDFFPETTDFNNLNNIPTINISDLNKSFIKISFSKPIDKSNITNLEKLISIESFFPKNLNYPSLEKISYLNDYEIIFEFSNFSYSDKNDDIYKLTINSSPNNIKSTENEYLEENVCALFISK